MMFAQRRNRLTTHLSERIPRSFSAAWLYKRCEQGDDLVRRWINDAMLTGNRLLTFGEELIASIFSVVQEE